MACTLHVSVNCFGAHRWPRAPEHRAYLREPHAHNFEISGAFEVQHDDRQLEFHDLQEEISTALTELAGQEGTDPAHCTDFGTLSCEGIARWLLEHVPSASSFTVMESAQAGATMPREVLGEGDGPVLLESSYLGWAGPHLRTITVCGSTRFRDETLKVIAALELDGWAVFSVGFYAHAENVELSALTKADLDVLHLRKIAMSDAIYVVNPGGYVGESTAREISYARALGKVIHWLERPS